MYYKSHILTLGSAQFLTTSYEWLGVFLHTCEVNVSSLVTILHAKQ